MPTATDLSPVALVLEPNAVALSALARDNNPNATVE